MSETIDLQPVIVKLSDRTEKQNEQTLKKELLGLQVSLQSEEETEKDQALTDIKSKLDAFELTLSPENAITPELQDSIDKAQTEITTLEAQQKTEEDAVVKEGTEDTRSLREKLTTSANPEQEFKSRWKGIGAKILGFIGIGGAVTGAVAGMGGDKTSEKTEATKGIFDTAKERVMNLFGLNEGKTETPPADTEAPEEDGSTKQKELVQKILKLNIVFKDSTPEISDVIETKDRLALLSLKTLTMINSVGEKFPGVRITSTLRSKEENDKLHISADNSKHMYGFAFDVGRDLRYPLQYTFEDVEEYIKDNFPLSKTLKHGENENEHLHVETDESTDSKTPYATDEDIKHALTPQQLVA